MYRCNWGVNLEGRQARRALLAGFLLCLGCSASSAGADLTRVGASDSRFIYEGRLDTQDPKGPVLAWQGSQVAVDFKGRDLAIDFGKATGQNFLDVRVDGRVWVAAVPEGGPTRVVYPLPLAEGLHHFSLVKRQEASAGSVQFLGVEVAAAGDVSKPPAPSYPLAVEFYGDSITAGACDEDGPEDQWENRRTHNALLSYAALTAEAFGAQWRNISVSGIGIATGWTNPLQAGQIWDRLYPKADAPVADLTLWVPDIVCVNLGDNDADFPKAKGKDFPSDFAAKYTDLIHKIRGAYPRAQIVLLMGGMESGSQSLPLHRAWNEAVAGLEAADPRIHHFVFKHWTVNHPRVSDHRILADELISWLKLQAFMTAAPKTS